LLIGLISPRREVEDGFFSFGTEIHDIDWAFKDALFFVGFSI
jgi:hypothetical protein